MKSSVLCAIQWYIPPMQMRFNRHACFSSLLRAAFLGARSSGRATPCPGHAKMTEFEGRNPEDSSRSREAPTSRAGVDLRPDDSRRAFGDVFLAGEACRHGSRGASCRKRDGEIVGEGRRPWTWINVYRIHHIASCTRDYYKNLSLNLLPNTTSTDIITTITSPPP